MNLSAAFIGKNASVDIASSSYNGAPTVRQGSERYKAIHCSMLCLMEVYAVRRSNLSLCATSQICMQSLTDRISILLAVKSIFKNPQSALLYSCCRQSLALDYPAF
jgi:hypothetical protein